MAPTRRLVFQAGNPRGLEAAGLQRPAILEACSLEATYAGYAVYVTYAESFNDLRTDLWPLLEDWCSRPAILEAWRLQACRGLQTSKPAAWGLHMLEMLYMLHKQKGLMP